MRVRHLNLVDYRNYRSVDVALAGGANLFVGKNGQGKTNLVEALGYLSTLGSHRVSQDQALIRNGADAAIIRARLSHAEREILAEVQINRSTPNRAQINKGVIKPRELPRYFSSVLFAPEDLALVRGEPANRRRFIDQLLILRAPRMAGVIADYERVLKQRNTLLKSARSSGLAGNQLSTLEIWDERLIEFGTVIITERNSLVRELREPMRSSYRAIVDADHGPDVTMELTVPADTDDLQTTSDNFRNALASVRRNEMDRGMTLVGPHRDDLHFELNQLPAKGYASHGESWSFALSLKLASADLLRRRSTVGDPVLILDDVFAELDAFRRARLAAAIGDYEQVLITAAVFEDIPESLRAHTVHIHAGTIIDGPVDV
ncbi:DNA replication/repair protein RecF [Homoserinimonas sp. OAct 916]|uniref:DNA replication/repair protein RecF n=1 Tax=Homoserinimonas sp. OAct 916 TaxID=2211450 RepID=UPI000DBE929F|nr:DNA replication/repair protein RecF [Homoserinimonas sp. OAct 916]